MFMIENKIIIVTGGASGLGFETSQYLLEKKATVIVFDIDKEKLNRLNKSFITYPVDVTSYDQVQSAVDDIIDKFGSVDVLVNNAGAIYSEPFINIMAKGDRKHSYDNYKKCLDINLTSVFIVSSVVVEKMVLIRTKGVVVNISSISAQGNAGQTVYSAAKAGVEALTKTWAKELGIFGIRVVAVSPGFMDTESTHKALNEKRISDIRQMVPLKTLGSARDVSGAVVFAIESGYVNGVVLKIDGGLKI
jgi:3-oxoacyl-[acyl-carrier protein] reductase